MNLSELITIVIPCKNEENYIAHLLLNLHDQMIGNTRIIIADCSTDNTRQVIKCVKGELNIEVIDGGSVSVAKNNGARLVNTPYILFLDADVRFFCNTAIIDAVKEIHNNNLDLVAMNIKCYDYNWRTSLSFAFFNFWNNILKYFRPFAVGAFMLTRKDKFNEYGGFPEDITVAEDWYLSKKYQTSKFSIVRHFFGQDSRRFKKMGYFGMYWLMFKNAFPSKNPEGLARENNKKYWE